LCHGRAGSRQTDARLSHRHATVRWLYSWADCMSIFSKTVRSQYKTVAFLFSAIAVNRHHLGEHFKQLQHFLLRWAATRWKWQRFISKEETRLELEA
jgi:hypothetical protein